MEAVVFKLQDGTLVPTHFHVTEVGQVNKQFIDCGGTVRTVTAVNFQLWHANDLNHRLNPAKLLEIIAIAERELYLTDADIEVEYQQTTIGNFGLSFDGKHLVLMNKTTDCLAEDRCGLPAQETKVNLEDFKKLPVSRCSPGSGCC